MELAILIDFGSTFTKVVAADLASGAFLGRAQAPTTVDTDVTVGMERALASLRDACDVRPSDATVRLACSSAAGGLRIVAIGLVPSLTSEAAHRAALGAGAKVVKVFSHELTRGELAEIERLAPDMVLLCGGTDGGNRATLVANAGHLARSRLVCPFVVAGNKNAADEAEAGLREAGKRVIVADNVMPELNVLSTDSARAAIRDLFIERIVHAKGLDAAASFVDEVVMPTPMAVLEACVLLAGGCDGGAGLGDVLLLDVGGATTDVHSAAKGAPTDRGVLLRGLPEPYAKRTVEGDLGMRVNALSVLEALTRRHPGMAAAEPVAVDAATRAWAERVARETAAVPATPQEERADATLARAAVRLATERHAGSIEERYTPDGMVQVQTGKDLTAVRTVVGVGGIFVHGRDPGGPLAGAVFEPQRPHHLKPRAPQLHIDRRYVMFAAGLLARSHPGAALELMKGSLEKVGIKREGG